MFTDNANHTPLELAEGHLCIVTFLGVAAFTTPITG